MNLTVDASVFVAASRSEETHYAVSGQFLRQVRARRCTLFCPTLVLPECAAAIARPTGNARLAVELASLVETFPRQQLIPLDLTIAHRAVQVARDHGLRGADSVYVSVAEAFGSILVAWDAEMLERSKGVVTAMTPLEWMEGQAATE